MARILFAFLLAGVAVALAAGPGADGLTADQIMAKVGANQDRAVEARRTYVYQQKIRVATRRTNGKLMREETALYSATPGATGTQKQLRDLKGQYWKKGGYIRFDTPAAPDRESLDGSLVSGFRDDLADEKDKDGLAKDLFPLTTGEQENYQFRLKGETKVNGRPVYTIQFAPRDRDELTWAGEAWIDKEDFQPVHVTTKLSRRLPLMVRTMLGTDLPGFGFNVEYRRFEDGVWFPVSFGTEFHLRAVFFINRNITVALNNSQFAKATVNSSIQYEEPR